MHFGIQSTMGKVAIMSVWIKDIHRFQMSCLTLVFVKLNSLCRKTAVSFCHLRKLRHKYLGKPEQNSGIRRAIQWMDDLRFYVLFNSISVISGRCSDDLKGCVQWNSVYG